MSEQKPTIRFEDFTKLDVRVAKVTEVGDHPNADKLLVMQIDLGDERRQIIAGLKGHYSPEDLLGKQVVVVTNIEPRKMRGLESQAMLLAAVYEESGGQKVVVLAPDSEVPAGAAVS